MKLLAVLTILATAIPAAASAQPRILDKPALPAEDAALTPLLDQIVGERQVIDAATGNFEAAFDRTVKANANGRTLEAGMVTAVKSAGRAETVAVLHEGYPGLRRMAADKVRASMTSAEMKQAADFYASPTGRKLTAAAVASTRGSTASEIQNNIQAGVVAAMSPDDAPALTAFAATPAYVKLQTLGPELQKASVKWAETLMAGNADRIRRAVASAVQRNSQKAGK